MIKATVSRATIPSSCDYPFMWQSSAGCVYLRNDQGKDVIVGPLICDQKVGLITEPYTNDDEAWARRLPKGSQVVLVQQ